METNSQNEIVPSSDPASANSNTVVSRSELKTMDDFEIIHSYSRAEAIEDGFLVDMNQGEWDEVVKQHTRLPVACTTSVWALIQESVKNPDVASDYVGALHEVFFGFMFGRIVNEHTKMFVVKLGKDGQESSTLKATIGAGDRGEVVITIMLEGED